MLSSLGNEKFAQQLVVQCNHNQVVSCHSFNGSLHFKVSLLITHPGMLVARVFSKGQHNSYKALMCYKTRTPGRKALNEEASLPHYMKSHQMQPCKAPMKQNWHTTHTHAHILLHFNSTHRPNTKGCKRMESC